MINDPNTWINTFAASLQSAFGKRLLFVGLQGSYERGEATEHSDIDVITLLDTLTTSDLDTYRALLHKMPHADKGCGFICGREDLQHWPRNEIFQLLRDTRPVLGTLTPHVPAFTRQDIIDAAKVSVSGIYHLACHTYLYADPAKYPARLASLRKSAFFALRLLHYLGTGEYPPTKAALPPDARALLAPDTQLPALIHWASTTLHTL